ncbi:hypothetical protein [Pseudanabaena sp. PCC 6802]|nr:hypothetical protein [Pseudanabaena sp. PCC 6802]
MINGNLNRQGDRSYPLKIDAARTFASEHSMPNFWYKAKDIDFA